MTLMEFYQHEICYKAVYLKKKQKNMQV